MIVSRVFFQLLDGAVRDKEREWRDLDDSHRTGLDDDSKVGS